MDLETAHQLSLIQRNLEAAQLGIDNATELLNVVLQNTEVDDQPSVLKKLPEISAELRKPYKKRPYKKRAIKEAIVKEAVAKKATKKVATKKATKKAVAKKSAEDPIVEEEILDDQDLDALVPAPKSAAGIASAIREFTKHRTGTFTADDLVKWGRAHGYFFDRKQYASNLSFMVSKRGEGKYGVTKTDKEGVFVSAA
jgi:ferritin-like protein